MVRVIAFEGVAIIAAFALMIAASELLSVGAVPRIALGLVVHYGVFLAWYWPVSTGIELRIRKAESRCFDSTIPRRAVGTRLDGAVSAVENRRHSHISAITSAMNGHSATSRP